MLMMMMVVVGLCRPILLFDVHIGWEMAVTMIVIGSYRHTIHSDTIVILMIVL